MIIVACVHILASDKSVYKVEIHTIEAMIPHEQDKLSQHHCGMQSINNVVWLSIQMLFFFLFLCQKKFVRKAYFIADMDFVSIRYLFVSIFPNLNYDFSCISFPFY